MRLFARALLGALGLCFVATIALAQFLPIGVGRQLVAPTLAYAHSAFVAVGTTSPMTGAYTPAAGSKLLWAHLEYDDNSGACTSPTLTFGGTSLTRAVNTTRSQGGENPIAEFYLISPSGLAGTAANFVVTCSGTAYFNLMASDYSDPTTPYFDTSGITCPSQSAGPCATIDGTAENTYSHSITVNNAGDLVLMGASNSGNTATTAACGGGVILRVVNSFISDSMCDTGSPVGAGSLPVSATLGFNTNGRTNRQSHGFMAFAPSAPAPHISGISPSSLSFTVPIAAGATVGTVTATCSIGNCSSATFANGTTSGCATTNADFNVSSTGVVTTLNAISAAYNRNLCVQISLVGADNTPQLFSVAMVGSVASANNVVLLNNKLQKMDVAGVGNFAIFQGAMPDRTDVLIANLSNSNNTNATYVMSTSCGTHQDNAKFKIVGTSGQWVVDSRPGPFLETNGAQSVQSGGPNDDAFHISIAGTDSGGTFCTPITIGDVPYNPGSKTPLTVTSTIQAAVNAANPSTQYVYVPPGTYGGFTGVNGVDVVSATTQNHINGGTSRATVASISPASNEVIYGFNIQQGMNFGGTSNLTFRNIIMDSTSNGPGSNQFYCYSGDTNLRIEWSRFSNGNGGNNAPCSGDNETNLYVGHNVAYNIGPDWEGGTYSNSSATYDADFQDNVGTTHDPSGCCGIGGLEWQCDPNQGCQLRGNVSFNDMYAIRNNNGNNAFAWSLVAYFQSLSFTQGYCEDDPRSNGGCALEIGNDPGGRGFRVYQTAFGNTGGGSANNNLSVWGCYGSGNSVTDNNYLVYNNSCGTNTNQHSFISAPPWAAGAN